jgi:hypothetical protein
MSVGKKSPIVLMPIRGMQRELKFLYARRYAIDSLIQSLEAYNRARTTKVVDLRKRKTA